MFLYCFLFWVKNFTISFVFTMRNNCVFTLNRDQACPSNVVVAAAFSGSKLLLWAARRGCSLVASAHDVLSSIWCPRNLLAHGRRQQRWWCQHSLDVFLIFSMALSRRKRREFIDFSTFALFMASVLSKLNKWENWDTQDASITVKSAVGISGLPIWPFSSSRRGEQSTSDRSRCKPILKKTSLNFLFLLWLLDFPPCNTLQLNTK